MAAIYQNGQLDSFRPAKIIQRIQGSPGGPAAKKDIIHQHNCFAVNIPRNGGGLNVGRELLAYIVPVHADIQGADRNRVPPDSFQNIPQTSGQVDASALNP
ncbi:MAG: hypothetical protein JWM16_875 [Verrucomicrobiales bacterium]|nr:hypothetical protein [Verrucomicrobiales bacterium]